MRRYKSKFNESLNLNKILPGSLFKGDTIKKWLDYNIDYFFDHGYKPLKFIYESDSIFDMESKDFGKNDKDNIKDTLNKYKNKGTWFIKFDKYKTKIPYELIELYINKQ